MGRARFLQGIILACICFSMDWQAEAERAVATVKAAQGAAPKAREVEFTAMPTEDPDRQIP